MQIRPRGIHALAPHIVSLVKHIIENLDAQMGHADLIYIRKAHGKTNRYLVFVFTDAVQLVSNVARRLINLHQYLIG